MKQIAIALLSAAVVSAAQHGHHAHQHHQEKRDPTPIDIVNVPGPTVIVYELNGKTVSSEDVEEGIRNGTLVWAQDGAPSSAPSSSAAPSTYAAPSSSSTSSYVAPTSYSESSSSTLSSWSSSWSAPAYTSSTSSYVAPTTSSAAPTTSSASAAPTYSNSNSDNSPSSYSGSSTGVDSDFPDGELSCDTFPSAYGAVAVSWMGLGGWTGVQTPGSLLGGFSNILTQTTGTCSGDSCCTEGSYCSYACPAGYQKSQWPSTQGATGQSVGGILCENGKLKLTNPSLSKTLCMKGAEAVTVQVQNTMSQNAAVCRTDYPGTENMNVPLNAMPGTTSPLTCPDASKYYNWKGGSTSAQYYVNPKGVSLEDGCSWGSTANPWGNFAPLNLGVGYSNGAAWLAIFQNSPTSTASLDFTVEIKGDTLSGSCKYSNGQYCSGSGCSSSGGCTVSLTEGTATFVFSD